MRPSLHKNGAKPVWGIYVLIALIFISIFYFVFDPMESKFMPQCVFHHLTGLQCMGCGSQRVIHSLLHGDLKGAFQANALVTLSLPFIFFLIWLEIYRVKYSRLYAKVFSSSVIWSIGIILALWFLIRNIIGI